MKTFQIILLVLLTLRFVSRLYISINGKEAEKPEGFQGVIICLILFALLALCYFKAGAFSTIF